MQAIPESPHSPGFWCGCPLLLLQHCCAGFCKAVAQSSICLWGNSSRAKCDLVVICSVVKDFISLCQTTCESSYRCIYSHKRLYCKNLKTFSRCLPAHFTILLLLLAVLSLNQLVLCKQVCQDLKTTISFMFTLKNLKVLGEKPSLKMLLPSVSEMCA